MKPERYRMHVMLAPSCNHGGDPLWPRPQMTEIVRVLGLVPWLSHVYIAICLMHRNCVTYIRTPCLCVPADTSNLPSAGAENFV